MFYAAKCYWPGVTEADLKRVSDRAEQDEARSNDDGVGFLGSLWFAGDDLVLCLFTGPSRAAVTHASDRLYIPRERLMDAVWLQSDQRPVERARLCADARHR